MSRQSNYNGSCLCGKVQFEISGPIKDIVYCHCSLCRKAQGSAFAANGNIDTRHFRYISGEEYLTNYESASGQFKYFCKICGSPVISQSALLPDKVRIRLGVIDTEISEKIGAHIFVNSKAVWEDIEGDLPQFEKYEN